MPGTRLTGTMLEEKRTSPGWESGLEKTKKNAAEDRWKRDAPLRGNDLSKKPRAYGKRLHALRHRHVGSKGQGG